MGKRSRGAIRFFPTGYVPRPSQVEGISGIENEFKLGKSIVGFDGPTGVGKTHVMMTFAREECSRGGRTFILTSQKILQSQYESEFPPPQLEVLKGRNAYPCIHPDGKGFNCEDGYCRRNGVSVLMECISGVSNVKSVMSLLADPADVECPYWKQLLTVAKSSVAVFNFSSFLFQNRVGRFGFCDLMVLDEAHSIENRLLDFVKLELWENDLGAILMTFDRNMVSADEVRNWIMQNTILERIGRRLEELGDQENADILKASLDRELAARIEEKEFLEKLRFKIELFLSLLKKTDWIVKVETRKRRYGKNREPERVLVCRPIHARQFASDLLFSKAKRVLATSATLLDREIWASSIGVAPEEVGFVQVGCDFPVSNRPIKLALAGSMSYKNRQETLPILIDYVAKILAKHKGQRGIIHAHSFSLARDIVNGVGDRRLLLHDEEGDKEKILRLHREREDSVIVAPAMHEGIDLKDDLARFQILAKCPYPSIKDEVVAARMKEDYRWYDWQAALKTIQSYGRAVRHKNDWAVTYLLDSDFISLIKRRASMFPKWFMEAIS